MKRKFKGNGESRLQRAWEMMELGNNADYTLRGSLVVFLLRFFDTKKMKKGEQNIIACRKSSITKQKSVAAFAAIQ